MQLIRAVPVAATAAGILSLSLSLRSKTTISAGSSAAIAGRSGATSAAAR
jgi:hypothetical protein